MKYKNGDFAMLSFGIFQMGVEDEKFVTLLVETLEVKEIEKVVSLGFSNKHLDSWGTPFFNNVYMIQVKKSYINSAFRVYTHTTFKDEQCQVIEEKEGKIKIDITSDRLAREYHEDPYNGFELWVSKNELDEIWEDLYPVGGFPFPKDYPPKILLYKRGKDII